MHDPSYSPSGANVTPMAIYAKYDKITYAYPIYLRLKKLTRTAVYRYLRSSRELITVLQESCESYRCISAQ